MKLSHATSHFVTKFISSPEPLSAISHRKFFLQLTVCPASMFALRKTGIEKLNEILSSRQDRKISCALYGSSTVQELLSRGWDCKGGQNGVKQFAVGSYHHLPWMSCDFYVLEISSYIPPRMLNLCRSKRFSNEVRVAQAGLLPVGDWLARQKVSYRPKSAPLSLFLLFPNCIPTMWK